MRPTIESWKEANPIETMVLEKIVKWYQDNENWWRPLKNKYRKC